MKINDIVFVYQLKNEEDLLWHSRSHNHRHGEAELTYFMSGAGTFTNQGRKYRISDNYLFINTEKHIHHVSAEDLTKPLSYYAILYTPGNDEQDLMQISRDIESQGPNKIKNDMRFFFEEMRRKAKSSSHNLNLSAEYQLMQLLYMLPENEVLTMTQNNSYHIERALRFFQSHVSSKPTLSDAALALNLSESYLIRIFQSDLHTTPMKYFTHLKIDAAIGLLKTTTLSIKQIASKLEYSSEFHLSRQFKEHTGLSPSQYRKNLEKSSRVETLPDIKSV